MSKTFHLTEDHVALLQHVNIRWTDAEYGGPGVDAKRPFGNSGCDYIEREICEYVGLEPVTEDRYGTPVYDEEERREAVKTYDRLDTALTVVLSCQTFTPGVFTADNYRDNWSRETVEHGGGCPACGADVSLSVAGMFGEWICKECGVLQEISDQKT